MVKIELSGGNEFVAYNSLEEAIEAAAEWYDYLAADGGALIGEDFPRLHTDGIIDVNELNQGISDWEEQLAKGRSDSAHSSLKAALTFGQLMRPDFTWLHAKYAFTERLQDCAYSPIVDRRIGRSNMPDIYADATHSGHPNTRFSLAVNSEGQTRRISSIACEQRSNR